MGVVKLRRLAGIGFGIALIGVTLASTVAIAGVSCDIDDTYTMSSQPPCWAEAPEFSIQVDDQGVRYAYADAGAGGRQETQTRCYAWADATASSGPAAIDVGGHYTAEIQVGDEPRVMDEQYYPFHAEESDRDDAYIDDGQTWGADATGFAENLISTSSPIEESDAESYTCDLS